MMDLRYNEWRGKAENPEVLTNIRHRVGTNYVVVTKRGSTERQKLTLLALMRGYEPVPESLDIGRQNVTHFCHDPSCNEWIDEPNARFNWTSVFDSEVYQLGWSLIISNHGCSTVSVSALCPAHKPPGVLAVRE